MYVQETAFLHLSCHLYQTGVLTNHGRSGDNAITERNYINIDKDLHLSMQEINHNCKGKEISKKHL